MCKSRLFACRLLAKVFSSHFVTSNMICICCCLWVFRLSRDYGLASSRIRFLTAAYKSFAFLFLLSLNTLWFGLCSTIKNRLRSFATPRRLSYADYGWAHLQQCKFKEFKELHRLCGYSLLYLKVIDGGFAKRFPSFRRFLETRKKRDAASLDSSDSLCIHLNGIYCRLPPTWMLEMCLKSHYCQYL